MTTLELTMAIDELIDYNEMGANPNEPTYDMIIMAEVDIHSRIINSVSVYDTSYMVSISFDILTAKDQSSVKARILDFITNNIDFLIDNLKDSKVESDIDHYRDRKS